MLCTWYSIVTWSHKSVSKWFTILSIIEFRAFTDFTWVKWCYEWESEILLECVRPAHDAWLESSDRVIRLLFTWLFMMFSFLYRHFMRPCGSMQIKNGNMILSCDFIHSLHAKCIFFHGAEKWADNFRGWGIPTTN